MNIKQGIVPLVLMLAISCSKEIIITENEISDDLFYIEQEIDPYTGRCKVVNTDTTLIKEMLHFSQGKLDGEASSYYTSGQLKWRGSYKDGLMCGKWVFWNEDGNKTLELLFKNDTMNGDCTNWYANGQVREKGKYAGNRKTGEWVCYTEKGQVVRNKVY